MKSKIIKKQGYSLVETIVYVSILSVFFVIIINSVLSFTKPYREILILRSIERTGLDSMERITREIRSASSVDLVNSTLGSSPGVLALTSTYNGISTTTRFYIDNGTLKMDINGSYQGPLSTPNTSVTNLVFRRLTNSVSTAVKVDMTVESSVGSTTKTKKYYSTVILKGN